MTSSVPAAASTRNTSLDVLRGIAILMVLVCHGAILSPPTWDAILWRPCWSGVDLFFVISGFLISGLLFAEFKRSGKIRFRRFAIRRALKIYPAFYVLVLITVAVRLAQHRYGVLPLALHDLFFIQSYAPGTWGHFWSLSVEEHFYILLPILMFLLIRRSKDNRTNPFTAIPKLFLVIGPLVLIARLLTAKLIPYSLETHNFPTHLRLDSLFFGVVISYFYQFHEGKFTKFTSRWRYFILGAAAGFLAPIFVIGQYQPWMYTYGFSCIYVGYGLLLIGLLQVPIQALPRSALLVLKVLANIGTFSYSIYLWHGLCSGMVSAWLPARFSLARLIIFYPASLLVGIVCAKIIEFPVLRVRDRLFPSKDSPVESSTALPVRTSEEGTSDVVSDAGASHTECSPNVSEASA